MPDKEIPSDILFIVDEQLAGIRLDLALCKVVEVLPSRSFAAKLVQHGHVLLNHKAVKASAIIKKGDSIFVDLQPLQIQNLPPLPENIPLNILYEDSEILVINKPCGMVVHPGAGVRTGTLVNAVLAHCQTSLPSFDNNVYRAGIVHRLDKDTSGVMVVAKTQSALSFLSQQFAQHGHGRIYQTIVLNKPILDDGIIETWHGRCPSNRLRYAVMPEGVGKHARMHYKVLEVYGNNLATQVQCELFTGRTHQIRVQMKSIGCPVLGDVLYGVPAHKLMAIPSIWKIIEPHLTRQMLHAVSLTIEHPTLKKRMEFVSPLPNDFMAVCEALRHI